jgi:membrane-associated phospholipid phosphatase
MSEENKVNEPIAIPLETRFAKLITAVFHPLFIPTYGMCVLYRIFSNMYFIRDVRIPLLLIGITLVSTCLLPALSVFLLLRSQKLSNLQMEERKERTLPFLITVAYYLFAYYMLREFPVPSGMLRAIRVFTLGAASALSITIGINFMWKISAHAVGMGGLCGAMAALTFFLPVPPSLNWFCLVVFLAGLVGYARLQLQAHTPAQVYAGYLLGFAPMFGLLLLF